MLLLGEPLPSWFWFDEAPLFATLEVLAVGELVVFV